MSGEKSDDSIEYLIEDCRRPGLLAFIESVERDHPTWSKDDILAKAKLLWHVKHNTSEGNRFIGRNIDEIEDLTSKGLREDGLPE